MEKTGQCTNCAEERKTEWANKSGKYLEDEKSDWLELCISCHRKYDFQYNLKLLGATESQPAFKDKRLQELLAHQ